MEKKKKKGTILTENINNNTSYGNRIVHIALILMLQKKKKKKNKDMTIWRIWTGAGVWRNVCFGMWCTLFSKDHSPVHSLLWDWGVHSFMLAEYNEYLIGFAMVFCLAVWNK